jgi:hypothetical protein
MEQRPAAASARTRSLLAAVCLLAWIIGDACATGKSIYEQFMKHELFDLFVVSRK